jgi:3-dehydrosphinganine reductase
MKIRAQFGLDKNVLITGGSSGIGLALAQQLVRQGNNVTLVARRKELLDQRVSELTNLLISPDQRILGLQADVAAWDQVQALASQMIKIGALPDLIINSAGVVQPGYVQDLEVEHFHWMMDINYHGTVHVIKAFLPEMMQRKSGYIINIASGGGLAGIFGYTGYCGSKFALRGFSDALRYELAPYHIGVSVVYPSDTDTPQLEYDIQHKPPETKAITETAGRMSADSVAKYILEAARRGKQVILPGFEAGLLYFLSTNFGGKVIEWVSKFILYRVAKGGNQKKAIQ